MRVGIGLALLLTCLAGCYQQPEVPRDKPLRCMSDDEGECPVGFRCIASGVCALINCQTDDDCAQGLVCTERTGCDLPGAGDGGSDATREGGAGGLLPGGLDGGAGGLPDAPAPLDSGPTPDAPGGGS